MTNEDVRLKFKTATAEGGTNEITMAVKKGGAKKILETHSLHELGQALRENVTIVNSEDGTTNQRPSSRSETNGLPTPADRR
jgi:hypothetical protein